MRNTSRLYVSLLIALGMTLAGWLARANMTITGKGSSPGSTKMEEQAQRKSPKDPCWFMTLKDESITYEMIKERQDREMHGYPTEIPLSEAINIFNEEKQCVSSLAPYPRLTEDELIAAIVAGTDYGLQGEVLRTQKDALWTIAKRRVMPKGSLLVATTGAHVPESPLRPDGTIRAEGITIVLRLGLENYEYGEVIRPEQMFVIRKTYTRIETLK